MPAEMIYRWVQNSGRVLVTTDDGLYGAFTVESTQFTEDVARMTIPAIAEYFRERRGVGDAALIEDALWESFKARIQGKGDSSAYENLSQDQQEWLKIEVSGDGGPVLLRSPAERRDA